MWSRYTNSQKTSVAQKHTTDRAKSLGRAPKRQTRFGHVLVLVQYIKHTSSPTLYVTSYTLRISHQFNYVPAGAARTSVRTH